MQSTPQRWLILAHAYNMDGRAASHTVTDKIPLLKEAGIQPIVLSASTGQTDPLVEHHAFGGWAPSALKFEMRHRLRKHYGDGVRLKVIKALLTLGILPFYAIERAFIHLDSQWSWHLPAERLGRRIIREKTPVLIYSSGGANCAHFAAYHLARTSGLPWIAEVHDPMVHDNWHGSKQAYRRAARIEELICKHADAAWWFTEGALENARKRHPELGNRGHLIVPGCHKPDFGTATYEAGKHLVFAHFGSLHHSRNLARFMQAMRAAGQRDPAFLKEARLHVYGAQLDSLSHEALRETALEEIVVVHGRLEHDPHTGKSGRARVLEAMRRSDVLVLLHGEGSDCAEYIPSKLFEYAWTRRPILGLIRDNPMLERMLHEQGQPTLAADNTEQLTDTLLALFKRWRNEGLPDNPKASPYDVRSAVDKILHLTHSLTNTQPQETHHA